MFRIFLSDRRVCSSTLPTGPPPTQKPAEKPKTPWAKMAKRSTPPGATQTLQKAEKVEIHGVSSRNQLLALSLAFFKFGI